MPAGFQRRKRNTTCFMYNEKAILWDIEFRFIHALDTQSEAELNRIMAQDLVASYSEYSCVKPRISETTKLMSLLTQFIETNDSIESLEKDNKLFLYQNIAIEGISVLFRDENCGKKQQKYYELDLNQSIREILSRKTVIEFPTFLVILKKFKHLFEIISKEVVNKVDK